MSGYHRSRRSGNNKLKSKGSLRNKSKGQHAKCHRSGKGKGRRLSVDKMGKFGFGQSDNFAVYDNEIIVEEKRPGLRDRATTKRLMRALKAGILVFAIQQLISIKTYDELKAKICGVMTWIIYSILADVALNVILGKLFGFSLVDKIEGVIPLILKTVLVLYGSTIAIGSEKHDKASIEVRKLANTISESKDKMVAQVKSYMPTMPAMPFSKTPTPAKIPAPTTQ